MWGKDQSLKRSSSLDRLFLVKFQNDEKHLTKHVQRISLSLFSGVPLKKSGESWDEQFLLTSTKALESARNNNGKIDWDYVKRAVAASEPPRINDVPAHCRFIQKYGGADHKYSMDMLELLDIVMPSGRIVSGYFLDKLASLKLPPKDMIPRMAHACVLAQACGVKERESVGTTLTEGNVKSLVSSNKVSGLKGETIIGKAYEMLDVVGPDHKRKGIVAIGDLQVDIVHHIFELNSQYETMDDILQQFLTQIVSKRWALLRPTDTNASPLSTVVNYTPDGNDAGRATVTNVGFSIGVVVEPKKVAEDEDIQYMIKYINDDGSVGAQRIDHNGAESKDITIIEMDELVNKYRHTQKKIALVEGYPENAAIESDEFKNMILRGAVALALKRLSADDAGAYMKMQWRSQKYPKERLFAVIAAKAGKIRIVPITHKFAEQSGSNVLEVVVDGVKLMPQRNVTSQCTSEFFLMRIVHEEQKANMKMRTFKETVDGIVVQIPCAVSFKVVAENDEVVLYKPAPNKITPKAKAVAAVLEPAVKKFKTA
jgi:hypothetical protein